GERERAGDARGWLTPRGRGLAEGPGERRDARSLPERPRLARIHEHGPSDRPVTFGERRREAERKGGERDRAGAVRAEDAVDLVALLQRNEGAQPGGHVVVNGARELDLRALVARDDVVD